MNRKPIVPLILTAVSVASLLLVVACGQNYSDKPADGALAERNLTPLANPHAVAGAKAAPVVPAGPAYGAVAAGAGSRWGDIVVQVPADWQAEEPSSSMRLAQYAIPAVHGGEGVGLAVFPGPMGSVDDNVNRWIGQFSQPDGKDSASAARRWDLTTDAGIEATFVDVFGTFSGGMGMGGGGAVEDYRMLGAIVEKGSTILYLKLTGPAVEVEDLQKPFEQLVTTMKGG